MNFGKVQTSFEAAAKKAGLLGTLFWWDLGSNRVGHGELTRLAKDAGLDEALLPAAVKPSTAFKRAARAAARRIGDELLLREIDRCSWGASFDANPVRAERRRRSRW